LDTILLISPSTIPQRSRQIVELCSGFVYYLSVAGITGERDALPADLTANVTSLRQMSHTPVCVGFGISKPQHLAQLNGIADGAIVGSAFVRKITQALDQGAQEIGRRIGDFCSELLGGLDR
jgi:tryptophan synthase alpha chain